MTYLDLGASVPLGELDDEKCRSFTVTAGLDIGYVPAGAHAFFRLSGQFGPPQFIFHWPEGPVVVVFFFF